MHYYYFIFHFNSFNLLKASIGVRLLTSIFFNSCSTSLIQITSFSIYSTIGSVQRVSCHQKTLLCSISNFLSIFFASVIVELDNQAIFATSSQKDFFIHPGIIFLRKTRFSSFSQTATEKFETHFKFFDSSINS